MNDYENLHLPKRGCVNCCLKGACEEKAKCIVPKYMVKNRNIWTVYQDLDVMLNGY